MEYDLIDIEDIEYTNEFIEMVDIEVDDDHTFVLSDNIISHNSAAGSILQKRDPTTDAVYTLRGKIKNVRTIEDLSNNKEILDLMNILNLNLDDKGSKTQYKKVIIATDADCLDENIEIITQNGIKKIKNINYNDKVLTHTGNYKSIKHIVKTIKNEFIEIKINGEFIKCSKNHIFLIMRDGNIIEEIAQNIKKTDFFLLKRQF